jgi:hypothetical protein
MATETDDTVYCDVHMPLDTGRRFLRLVTALRESEVHPELETVFRNIEDELKLSIDLLVNPTDWSNLDVTRH